MLSSLLLARRATPSKRLAPMRRHAQARCAMSLSGGEMTAKAKRSMMDNPAAWWLFGCAGLVGATLTVGAAARLTRSGASMLYWVPKDSFPPRSDEDLHREFEVYEDFARRHQRRPMSFEDFKRNFKFENLHRKLGEATTLAYLGPLAYFYVKEKLPTSIQPYLAGVLALGATQMYLGRRLVETQVNQQHGQDPDEAPNFVAPHGLAFHSAFSMANMALLLWAGLHLAYPATRAIQLRQLTLSQGLRDIGKLRQYYQYVTALFLGTAGGGTLVAAIDAGKEFNTFPKMGDRWIPDGLMDRKPWVRNFYENVALVQLDHRVLAVGTLAAYSYVFMLARRPHIWENLPPEAKKAINWTMVAVGGQVAGGITMLVNAVPTTLAMVHQSGAGLILGTSLWTLYTLRFAKPSGLAQVAKMASKAL
ncbi:hypothetical protein ATCC90586_010351 [Pythium insidiosum]|nr:hypothetical protein ATCC90586_010351 [Pythium insidiosum]